MFLKTCTDLHGRSWYHRHSKHRVFEVIIGGNHDYSKPSPDLDTVSP
jgi:hypothetical protein